MGANIKREMFVDLRFGIWIGKPLPSSIASVFGCWMNGSVKPLGIWFGRDLEMDKIMGRMVSLAQQLEQGSCYWKIEWRCLSRPSCNPAWFSCFVVLNGEEVQWRYRGIPGRRTRDTWPTCSSWPSGWGLWTITIEIWHVGAIRMHCSFGQTDSSLVNLW